jgi:hypothetical protein
MFVVRFNTHHQLQPQLLAPTTNTNLAGFVLWFCHGQSDPQCPTSFLTLEFTIAESEHNFSFPVSACLKHCLLLILECERACPFCTAPATFPPRNKTRCFVLLLALLHSVLTPISCLFVRVSQNHTFLGIYGVYTVFLAEESPCIRSSTVQMNGTGQHGITPTGLPFVSLAPLSPASPWLLTLSKKLSPMLRSLRFLLHNFGLFCCTILA